MVFHETEGIKWLNNVSSSKINLITSNELFWCFSSLKDGISICSSYDCSLLRKVSTTGGLCKLLSLNEQNLLLVFDANGKINIWNVQTSSKQVLNKPIETEEIQSVSTNWLFAQKSIVVINKKYLEGFVLQIFTQNLRDQFEIVSTIELNATSPSCFYVNRSGDFVWVENAFPDWKVSVYKIKNQQQFSAIVKDWRVSSCSISNDGQFVSIVNLDEACHVFRVLSFREQIENVVLRPFSGIMELLFSFLLPGILVALFSLSIILQSYPWDVARVLLEVFCFSHIRL
jgi:hypothetical protein